MLAIALGGNLAAVSVGAVGGALLRYAAVQWAGTWGVQVAGRSFPIGTLMVNALGCFLAGVLLALSMREGSTLPEPLRLALGVGFLGSLTTFSAFSVDTLVLLKAQAYGVALLNVAAQMVLCLLLVVLGHALASR